MIDLARLAQIAPAFCVPMENGYEVDSGFKVGGLYISSLITSYERSRLRDALEIELYRRRWGWRVETWEIGGGYAALVWHLDYTGPQMFAATPIEALVAAFVAAVEAGRKE